LWPLSIAKLMVSDPVSDGFVASLAKPGGNITGFTIFEHSFAGKWLEMLKEAAPTITRVAVMQNPDHPAWEGYLRAIGTVASALGVAVTPAPVYDATEIEHRAFISLLGGAAAAWSLAARAQQAVIPVVGFLNSTSLDGYRPMLNAFRQGLQQSGYVEGRNVAIEYRWAEGRNDRLPGMAAELVRGQRCLN
jgi:ABC transporter substrate binding protein